MRALIELYHKSETFITPETLDQAIDEAFINIPEVHMATIAQRDRSREELTKHVTGRRTLAKLGNSQMLEQVQELSGGLYSDTKSEREEKLQAALYGAFRMKPSLETVIEEAYRFQEEKEVEGTKQ
ncbi:hypothetical protein EUX98_g393 [Antrodiella citrinella]|uniref:Uncharacterized protein n=1 Tax=Antrodiella citrinella TaxID=2447956 RepID=A0A4S4N3W2_9APHY|nr:hypothetical protein EUX98_g393 [Antrodiella citrinella]